MKELISFLKNLSLKNKFLLFLSVVRLPASLFHHLCYVIAACFFLVKIYKIECHYFYQIRGNVLYDYSFAVTIGSIKESIFNRIRLLIINISPIIGVVILLCFFPISIIYVIISWRTFKLSETDLKNVKDNLHHIKSK